MNVNFGLFAFTSERHPRDGGRLCLNEDGTKEFYTHYARPFSRFDIYNQFIGAEHPRYASVSRDGIVRVAHADPSTVSPDNEYFVATDNLEVGPFWLYDVEANTFSPPPPLPPMLVSISADILYAERMTDDEFDALDDSVRSVEGARVYRGFVAVQAFTEGTDMWALLVRHLDLTVTPARRDELLARPVANAAITEDVAAA